MSLTREYQELFDEYVAELRKSKEAAEQWWRDLQKRGDLRPGGLTPQQLWPMGPASHPWVIATYRKYYFQCVELNQRHRRGGDAVLPTPREDDWGVDDSERPAEWVEPKIFVLDLLAGGETHDLYEFLLSLVLVPVGIKGDVAV